jgi:hypothetical protein
MGDPGVGEAAVARPFGISIAFVVTLNLQHLADDVTFPAPAC